MVTAFRLIIVVDLDCRIGNKKQFAETALGRLNGASVRKVNAPSMSSVSLMPVLRPAIVVLRISLAIAALFALAACATPPEDPEDRLAWMATNDPLEPMNRDFFEFNRVFDAVLLRPVSEFYGAAVPEFARDRVTNFLRNIRSPVILANDLMQGEFERANNTWARFLVNSVFGVAGLFDVSRIPPHDEDFGQTLAVWGLSEGPYLVLPILGPSSPRALLGRGVDTLIDPVTWLAWTNDDFAQVPLGRTLLGGIDLRSRNIETLKEIEKSSIDFYATIRSLYRQRRNDEIRNGAPAPVAETDDWLDFDDEEFDDEENETGDGSQD